MELPSTERHSRIKIQAFSRGGEFLYILGSYFRQKRRRINSLSRRLAALSSSSLISFGSRYVFIPGPLMYANHLSSGYTSYRRNLRIALLGAERLTSPKFEGLALDSLHQAKLLPMISNDSEYSSLFVCSTKQI